MAVLSPWPTESPDRAIKRLQDAVQGAACGSYERADALGAAASAMVERYAPNAPQPVKDEAVIRFAGYLAQSDFGGIAKESVGPMETEYVTNHAAMFRNSGAAALLSRWRVRRAGAIG